jgi:ESCRT-I complex subunit VPS37
LARLRAATSNQDHLSEQLISTFIDGGMSEEDFSRQFKEVRRVYHRRKACLDKWEKGSVVWRT